MTELALCAYCGKPLKGRSDKRYCNDDCRNAFFNERRKDEQKEVRIIDLALKKNRRILQATLGLSKTKIVEEKTLLQKGFMFKYSTHSFKSSQLSTYRFVYDYGYKEISEGKFMVVKEIGRSEP
jgi:predicted nucleic acid-binding Zn ribbon protein